jgi:hypothetical protein
MTKSNGYLNQFFTSDISLWRLFISSFLAAISNTLGGMVTFGTGWLLPPRKGGSKAGCG